jgi:hypothetical protein
MIWPTTSVNNPDKKLSDKRLLAACRLPLFLPELLPVVWIGRLLLFSLTSCPLLPPLLLLLLLLWRW